MNVENLLKLLKEHKVRFVIIGATAFPVHGYSRATLDIDFVYCTQRTQRQTDTQGTVKKSGIVFVVALMLSAFASFLSECVEKHKPQLS